jgi:hypothetical protein
LEPLRTSAIVNNNEKQWQPLATTRSLTGRALKRSTATGRLGSGGEAKRHCECLSGDALRGDDERAAHLIRNTLHGAIAYANFAGDFDDAHAGPQTILDALFNGCADAHTPALASVTAAVRYAAIFTGPRAPFPLRQS